MTHTPHSPFRAMASAERRRPGLLSLFVLTWLGLVLVLVLMAGCGPGRNRAKKDDFFTSGSREADQRASQRMARAEQLEGSGEGAGEDQVKKARRSGDGVQGAQAENKLTLFDRLGGSNGVSAIVEDFVPRALQDPRVNWARRGMDGGGFFSRRKPATWNASEANVGALKQHLKEFLALATGGPPNYQGRQMKSVHAAMEITNPEFDAAIGDFKASLDRLQVPNKEQKELLAILESTRAQIVTER